MKRSQFSEEQIHRAVTQMEADRTAEDFGRELGDRTRHWTAGKHNSEG